MDVSQLFDLKGDLQCNCKGLLSAKYVKRLFGVKKLGEFFDARSVHSKTVLDLCVKRQNALRKRHPSCQAGLSVESIVHEPQGNQMEDHDLSTEGLRGSHSDLSAGVLVNAEVAERGQVRAWRVADSDLEKLFSALDEPLNEMNDVCSLARLADKNEGVFLACEIVLFELRGLDRAHVVKHLKRFQEVLCVKTGVKGRPAANNKNVSNLHQFCSVLIKALQLSAALLSKNSL